MCVKMGKYIVYGVVSQGSKCAGVRGYSRVSKYLIWTVDKVLNN